MNCEKKTIVLVEDDELILDNYSELLADEGYIVKGFSDRHVAYNEISCTMPDLAILDIGLGRERKGGILLCNQLRELSTTLPIIFLTSYESDEDRIEGIRCEVDDYIVKGESIDYLIVRVATLFRRMDKLTDRSRFHSRSHETGSLRLDLDACMAYWKGQRVSITLTQYWMLQELALRPGHTKSPSKLMSVANMVVEPNTIAANIKSIRKRFKEIDPVFDQIKAEYGVGYRWIKE